MNFKMMIKDQKYHTAVRCQVSESFFEGTITMKEKSPPTGLTIQRLQRGHTAVHHHWLYARTASVSVCVTLPRVDWVQRPCLPLFSAAELLRCSGCDTES